jgi:hypothetical protein
VLAAQLKINKMNQKSINIKSPNTFINAQYRHRKQTDDPHMVDVQTKSSKSMAHINISDGMKAKRWRERYFAAKMRTGIDLRILNFFFLYPKIIDF